MVARAATTAEVWTWLAAVPDPEIPVISILELGIVRDVTWSGSENAPVLEIALTPTYSGCPAIRQIERDIVALMHAHGVEHVELSVRLAPAWTTDWLTDAAREKLRAYGISPPGARARDPFAPLDLTDALAVAETGVTCPRCASENVALLSRFASTACKAHYRCNACREPFDHFKAH